MSAIDKIISAVSGLEDVKVVREVPGRIVNSSDLPLCYLTVDSIETRNISFDERIDKIRARLTLLVMPAAQADASSILRVRELTEAFKKALDSTSDAETYVSYTVSHQVVEVGGIQYLAAVFELTAVEEEVTV